MDTGRIKLGAIKELSGKPLSGVLPEGFFYGGDVVIESSLMRRQCRYENVKLIYVAGKMNPARQHLILQTYGVAQSGRAQRNAEIRFKSYPVFSNFYDNPSQKRLARCTNIPQTGALPTVKGVEQRLRKGFQGQMRSSASLGWPLTDGSEMRCVDGLAYFGESLRDYSMGAGMREACLSIESLSSAAVNKVRGYGRYNFA